MTGLACYGLVMGSLTPPQLHAHPISLTSAEINVTTNRIDLTLDVLVEDLVLFHKIQPGPDGRYAADQIRGKAPDHGQFLLQYVTLRNADGQPYQGRMEAMDLSDLTNTSVASEDLMKQQIQYQFHFPAPEPPAHLTIHQDMGGETALIPALMDVSVSQNGIWLDKPVQLPNRKPFSVRLDWENPPTTPPQDWAELRKRKQEEWERRLGMSNYGGVYSYIYVTEHEVRHELLLPLLTLETWIRLPRANPDFIDVKEQDKAISLLDTFLVDKLPANLNDQAVHPRLDQVRFFGLDIDDFARGAKPRRMSVYQARVGIILSYDIGQRPDKVTVPWTLYSDETTLVQSVVLIGDETPARHRFTRDTPTWHWQRPPSVTSSGLVEIPRPEPVPMFRLPWLSVILGLSALAWLAISGVIYRGRLPRAVWLTFLTLVLVGALCLPVVTRPLPWYFGQQPQLNEEQTKPVLHSLLTGIYGSFEKRDEDSVYESLAQHVKGRFLEKLYLDIRRTLELENQGGAMARVREVQVNHSQIRSRILRSDGYPTILCQVSWQAAGTVEHWGHVHTRRNAYDADIYLIGTDSGWQISDCKISQEELLHAETRLRE